MPKHNKPVIAVDFDGVIHGYSEGWKDGSIYDSPIVGCKNALTILAKQYRILIWSTRNYDRVINGESQSNQVEDIKAYLEKHQIPYDEIYIDPNKPMCDLFIDDNAYRFEKDWFQTLVDIERLGIGDE